MIDPSSCCPDSREMPRLPEPTLAPAARVIPDVTRNEVEDSGRKPPEKPARILSLLVATPVAGVVGLPNWLRGFDSRRPLRL